MIDLAELGERVADGMVEEGLRRWEQMEKSIIRPLGASDAPLDVRLEKFNRLQEIDQQGREQGVGPVGTSALVKLYGRKAVAQEYNELYPLWEKAQEAGGG